MIPFVTYRAWCISTLGHNGHITHRTVPSSLFVVSFGQFQVVFLLNVPCESGGPCVFRHPLASVSSRASRAPPPTPAALTPPCSQVVPLLSFFSPSHTLFSWTQNMSNDQILIMDIIGRRRGYKTSDVCNPGHTRERSLAVENLNKKILGTWKLKKKEKIPGRFVQHRCSPNSYLAMLLAYHIVSSHCCLRYFILHDIFAGLYQWRLK